MLEKIKKIIDFPKESISLLESVLPSLKEWMHRDISSSIDTLLDFQKKMSMFGEKSPLKDVFLKSHHEKVRLLSNKINGLPDLVAWYQQQEKETHESQQRVETIHKKGEELMSQPGMKEALAFRNAIIEKYL